MLNKYTDGKKIIYVTRKAFNLLYKDRGFFLYEESEKKNGLQKKSNIKITKRNSIGNSGTNQKTTSTRKSAGNK